MWHIGANDANFLGWFTTWAYLVTALLCFLAAARSSRRAFWLASACLLCLLGINKELDFQTPVSHTLHALLSTAGWSAYRNDIKWAFTISMLAGGLLAAAWALRPPHRDRGAHIVATLGLVLLLAYVGLRASPVERVDSLGGFDLSRIRGKRAALELSGLALVGLGAAVALKAARHRPSISG